mmetsp:Transcript_17815/g.46669  ORF Transcript_17815/g.46669 Transcript_17815/m.46669 type:complete len:428 (+) Transcript_17815:76-1359(+)
MLGRLCTAFTRHEGGFLAHLPESVLSAASRSLGDVSTSYSIPELPQQASQKRHMAKKSKKGSAPANPSFQGMVLTPPSQIQHPDHLARLQKLKMRRRTADHMPLPLGESQRELIKQVAAASKDPGVAEAATEQDPKAPEPGLKQLGLPLSQRDIVKMVHKSLSGAAEQNVHFRTYVFTNLFQSAPAVASYVANALESGVTWPRIERFFLSSVEADPGIGAIRVQVKGRLGRKATMASTKTWEHGQLSLHNMSLAVDHGMATAMTRVGILGIQVWVRYAGDAIANSMYRRNTGISRPFIQLLAAKREPLPYRSSTAWWNTPGPAQPALNETWNVFQPEFPSTSMPISAYLAAKTPQVFHHDKDRKAVIAREMETMLLQEQEEHHHLLPRRQAESQSEGSQSQPESQSQSESQGQSEGSKSQWESQSQP